MSFTKITAAGIDTSGTVTTQSISVSGVSTVGSLSIGATSVISSAFQLQNIASLDATTTATIESAISNAPNTFTNLNITGVSTFVNGPVLVGSGTSTGTAGQVLQATGGAYVSGNLGIGVTSPSYKLDIDNTGGSTATARVVGNDQANVRLRIQNIGSGGRAYEIVGGLNGANNSHLSVYDATAAATRLTITDTGLLGVGTNSPGYTLDVSGTFRNTGVARFGTGSTTTLAYFGNPDTVGNKYITFARASSLTDIVNSQGVDAGLDVANISLQALGGLLGVGTASPSVKLHVNGARAIINDGTGTQTGLSIGTDSTSTGTNYGAIDLNGNAYAGLHLRTGNVLRASLFQNSGTSTTLETNTSAPLIFGTNSTERLRITSAGLMGVGTTAPGSPLEIAQAASVDTSGAANKWTARFRDTTATAINVGGGLLFQGLKSAAGAVGNFAAIAGLKENATDNNENGYLAFFTTTNSTGLLAERARFDSSGRLGIGTTPSELLHIKGASPYMLFEGTETDGQTLYIRESAGSLAFGRYAIGERARIDSSGRLLVGTSSTSANLRALIQATSANSAGGGNLYLARGESTPADGASLGYLGFSDSNHASAAGLEAVRDGGTWTSGSSQPSRLVFSTTPDGLPSPTERMRIRADGASLYYSSASNGIVLGITGSSGTSNRLFSGGHSASSIGVFTETFLVWSNGNVQNTNNSYGAISDVKLKENIVDAGSQWADIKAFRVRKYNLKEGQKHTQIGGIAQEVELVSPGLVTESPDRDEEGNDLGTVTKSINYSVLYMKAVKALQEAMERIETLETRLSALEGA